MAARAVRTATLVAAAALLLAGCSAARKQAVSPREIQDPIIRAKYEALQEQTETLRREQAEGIERVKALGRQLKAEQEEQRRFRDMMATNFDLLEQSVALSLSKQVGRTPVIEPARLELPLPEVAMRKVGGTSPTRRPPPLPPTLKEPEAAPPGAPAPSPGTRKAADYRKTPGRGLSQIPSAPISAAPARSGGSVALLVPVKADRAETLISPRAGGSNGERLDDPDLTPPARPRILKAHPAARKLYDTGFTLFAHRKYDQAIMVYEDFLSRFPGDIYSDNAQFWIGEAYFQRDMLVQAEAAFRNVLRNYEHRSTLEGYKTPEAIYRIGLTFLQRGDTRRAGYYLANVAGRFPKSSAGRKAQRELEGLSVRTAGADESRAAIPES